LTIGLVYPRVYNVVTGEAQKVANSRSEGTLRRFPTIASSLISVRFWGGTPNGRSPPLSDFDYTKCGMAAPSQLPATVL